MGRFRETGYPAADRILDGTASAPLKLAAARGALPVPREALVPVLAYLANDTEPAMRAAAEQSLSAIPAGELTRFLGDPAADPALLDAFASRSGLPQSASAALVTNPALSDDSVTTLASTAASDVLEVLLINQQRLGRTPSAIEALQANPSLTGDQRRRLLDFVEHMGRARAPEPAEDVGLDPALLGPVSEEELRAMLGSMGDLPFINLEVGDFFGDGTFIEGAEEIVALGTSFESVFKQILRMSPAQRLRAALRGGREARAILIRDTNRIVATAVVRNPRLTDEEVVAFAAQKSLSEDILRIIGSSRAWTSNYPIIYNLVRNPKTPFTVALNQIGRLHTRDLQGLRKDRSVPEGVRRLAQRHVEMREAKPLKLRKH